MKRELDELLGIDEALAVEGSEVTIRVDTRRYGKSVTVLEGFDQAVDLQGVAKELKHHLGTGGTVKGEAIELQGDHRAKARAWLHAKGFHTE